MKQIEEVLQTEGVLVSTTVGTSMYPMLRNRKDTIVVKPCAGRLEKYDVALYKCGSSYILHRVLKVLPNSYVIRGDNCDRKEYGITDSQILGVLVECYRGDKPLNLKGWPYKFYVRTHILLFPIWKVYRLVKRVLKKIGRMILRKDRNK